MLFSALLDTVFSRINTLFIGKFYSATDLGHYSRADNLKQLPGNLLSGIIGRVSFPIFAAANEDRALLRSGLKKALTFTMMINIPVMLGMFATAKSMVLVLFGVQWLPCVPYVQILSLGGILWPLHVLNLNVLTAQGHSNLLFRMEIIKKSMNIVLLAAACNYGISAIAWSTVLGGVIGFVINAYYSGRLLGYGTLRQTLDLLPYVAVALLMVVGVWAVNLLAMHSPLILLLLQILVGVFVYALLCYLFRLAAFSEAINIMMPRIKTLSLFGVKS
jgi:O-antigen/teichoic acid export membrane protein